jgi:hypothetical protein
LPLFWAKQGPIPAYLYADSGFMGYTGGIYTHGCNNYANHAITVVGYGPDYWKCLNSWGDWWGDGGTFKVGLCVLTDFQLLGEINGMFFQETCDMRR